MSVRGINYDDSDPASYESVDIYHDNKTTIYNSGNFVKDWFDCLKFVLMGGIGEYPILSNSSSVDHFIMDGASKLYDSGYLIVNEEGVRIEYDTKYHDKGFEVFVAKGTTPTWEELKQLCK